MFHNTSCYMILYYVILYNAILNHIVLYCINLQYAISYQIILLNITEPVFLSPVCNSTKRGWEGACWPSARLGGCRCDNYNNCSRAILGEGGVDCQEGQGVAVQIIITLAAVLVQGRGGVDCQEGQGVASEIILHVQRCQCSGGGRRYPHSIVFVNTMQSLYLFCVEVDRNFSRAVTQLMLNGEEHYKMIVYIYIYILIYNAI